MLADDLHGPKEGHFRAMKGPHNQTKGALRPTKDLSCRLWALSGRYIIDLGRKMIPPDQHMAIFRGVFRGGQWDMSPKFSNAFPKKVNENCPRLW